MLKRAICFFIFTILLTFSGCSSSPFTDDNFLTGEVIYGSLASPVSNAVAKLQNKTTKTSVYGFFDFYNLSTGEHKLSIIPPDTLNNLEPKTMTITVKRGYTDLGEIVMSEKEEYRFRDPYVDNVGYFNTFSSLFKDKLAYMEIDVKGTPIKVYYGGNEYYIRRNYEGIIEPFDLSNQRDIYVYVENALNNSLIEINGNTYNINYEIISSIPENIAKISDKGVIAFNGLGNIIVKVSIGTFSNTFTVDVKDFEEEIKSGMTEEELINEIGFPDRKTYKTLPWYNPKGFFNGIYYDFGDSEPDDVNLIHWHYDKYPNVIFEMTTFLGLSMERTLNKGWDCGYCETY